MKTGVSAPARGWRLLCAAALALVFALSAAMAGTLAWSDLFQHRTGAAAGLRHPGAPSDFTGLAVTNTVENHDGSALTPAQAALPFSYTITFDAGGEYPLQIGESRSVIRNESSFTLRHGQCALIGGLPVGTVYTVIQTVSAGYAVSGTNHHGNLPPGGITASFVNTFGRPPESGPAVLALRKLVAGAGDLHQSFTVDVTIDGIPLTVTLRHGETRELDLPCGALYDVRERGHGDYMGRVERGFGTGTGGRLPAVITNDYFGAQEKTRAATTTISMPSTAISATTTMPASTTVPAASTASTTDDTSTTSAPTTAPATSGSTGSVSLAGTTVNSFLTAEQGNTSPKTGVPMRMGLLLCVAGLWMAGTYCGCRLFRKERA